MDSHTPLNGCLDDFTWDDDSAYRSGSVPQTIIPVDPSCTIDPNLPPIGHTLAVPGTDPNPQRIKRPPPHSNVFNDHRSTVPASDTAPNNHQWSHPNRLSSGSRSRQDSPFPQLSPCYSGAHSPSIDSEALCDGLVAPCTPPDTALMIPPSGKLSNEQWHVSSWQSSPDGLAFSPNVHQATFADTNLAPTVRVEGRGETGSFVDCPPGQTLPWDSVQSYRNEGAALTATSASHPTYGTGYSSTLYPNASTDVSIYTPILSADMFGDCNNQDTGRTLSAQKTSRKKSDGNPDQLRRPLDASISKRAAPGRRLTPGSGARGGGPSRSASEGTKQCNKCQSVVPLEKKGRLVDHGPFTCVFAYAGCPKVLCTKNEWKRHVATMHIVSSYWLCLEGDCAKQAGPTTRPRSRLLPDKGSAFNRKDLFSQHFRRMHVPADVRIAQENKRQTPEFEKHVAMMAKAAITERCKRPYFLLCPSEICDKEFKGADAYDLMMEHVTVHMDAAYNGREPVVHFNGSKGIELVNWAAMQDVGVTRKTQTGWRTCDPLREDCFGPPVEEVTYEEDAEGEEC